MTALGCTWKSFSLPFLWIIYPIPWNVETLVTRDTVMSDMVGLGSLYSFSIQVPNQFSSGCGSW